MRLFDRCTFLGIDWVIVFIDGDTVSLTSLDGKLFKKHINVKQIQLHDEFKDPYPNE
ncbi:MAG: hypothetical protein GX585_05940 [Clostridiales bacterium]|nr:hypothetical protein [Clostridiales bacterium]